MMYKILHGLVAVDALFDVRFDDKTREILKFLNHSVMSIAELTLLPADG